jgi:hypothetical protein
MKDFRDDMEVKLGPDGFVSFRAKDRSSSDPTDWNGDQARVAAQALSLVAQTAKDGPSRHLTRGPSGWFVLDDGPRAGDIGGGIGVYAVRPDGGACVLTASEAREFATALQTLADEDDAGLKAPLRVGLDLIGD